MTEQEAAPRCCNVSRPVAVAGSALRGTQAGASIHVEKHSTRGQVRLPGGVFAMGDHFDEGYPGDGEQPVHPVEVKPFWVDVTSVTNAQFATS